jgi:hypothetical protein
VHFAHAGHGIRDVHVVHVHVTMAHLLASGSEERNRPSISQVRSGSWGAPPLPCPPPDPLRT